METDRFTTIFWLRTTTWDINLSQIKYVQDPPKDKKQIIYHHIYHHFPCLFLPWVYPIPRPFPARRHQQLLNTQLGLGTPAGRVTHVSHEEVLLWHIQDCKGNGVEMLSKCVSCCICWSQITSMKLCFQWTKKTALIVIGDWQAQEVRIRIWHPNTGRVTND